VTISATQNFVASPIRIALGGLVALAAALGIGRFVYTPILPGMAAALHLTKSQAGLIASANFLGYLIGAMAATAPLFGSARRFWLLTGLVTNAAGLLAMAVTTDLALFAIIRFVAGLASGFVMVFGSALVMERLSTGGRSSLSSVYFMGPGAGITFSAALVAILAGCGVAWAGLWLANGLATCIALAVVAWAIPADAAGTGGPGAASPPEPLSRPVILLTAAYGLVGFGYVITSTFIVALVRETPSIATWEPYVWIVVGLAALPSAIVWAACARRMGTMRAFAAAAIVEAIGVATSVIWPTLPGIALAAILLGGTFIGLTAMGLVAVRTMMAGDPRRGIGLLTAVFGVGQIIGPLVAGVMHDMTGSFTEVTYMAAASLVVSAGLALAADGKSIA
jgi:predicted MFS family arabinose efflux permease